MDMSRFLRQPGPDSGLGYTAIRQCVIVGLHASSAARKVVDVLRGYWPAFSLKSTVGADLQFHRERTRLTVAFE